MRAVDGVRLNAQDRAVVPDAFARLLDNLDATAKELRAVIVAEHETLVVEFEENDLDGGGAFAGNGERCCAWRRGLWLWRSSGRLRVEMAGGYFFGGREHRHSC